MSEFDIFFDEYENKHNCSPEKYECFEAGQQSKQAEVDELQKRVDKVIEHIEDYYGVVGLSMIVDILKGEETK